MKSSTFHVLIGSRHPSSRMTTLTCRILAQCRSVVDHESHVRPGPNNAQNVEHVVVDPVARQTDSMVHEANVVNDVRRTVNLKTQNMFRCMTPQIAL